MPNEALLRIDHVKDITGWSESRIYKGVKDGTFPKQINIGNTRTVRWIKSEVDAWVDANIERARGKREVEERVR